MKTSVIPFYVWRDLEGLEYFALTDLQCRTVDFRPFREKPSERVMQRNYKPSPFGELRLCGLPHPLCPSAFLFSRLALCGRASSRTWHEGGERCAGRDTCVVYTREWLCCPIYFTGDAAFRPAVTALTSVLLCVSSPCFAHGKQTEKQKQTTTTTPPK